MVAATTSQSIWVLDSSNDIFVKDASANDWTKIRGKLIDISDGHSGIWGIGMNDSPYYRDGVTRSNPVGTTWRNMGPTVTPLKHISSGSDGVWGTDGNNAIYCRTGITTANPYGTAWQKVSGALQKCISVGASGVWGINRNGMIYRRAGVSSSNPAGTKWVNVRGTLEYLSSGRNGVWGVQKNGSIFFRTGVTDAEPLGTNWHKVHGGLRKIKFSGALDVCGVHSNGKLYRRLGVTDENPVGTNWEEIERDGSEMIQLSVGDRETEIKKRKVSSHIYANYFSSDTLPFRSDVTRYLMAASEGVICFPASLTRRYTIETFQKDLHNVDLLHYDPNSVKSKWWGHFDCKFATRWDQKTLIQGIADSADWATLQKSPQIFTGNTQQIARETHATQEEVRKMWESGVLLDAGEDETSTLAIWLGSKGCKGDDQKAFSKTLLLLRVLKTILDDEKSFQATEQVLTIADAVEEYKAVYTDDEMMGEVVRTWAKPKVMFLTDCKEAHTAGVDVKSFIVMRAKQRILMQLQGVGGFVVERNGRKFEISSRGDGSTGLYYREFVIAETFTSSEEHTTGGSVSAGFEDGAFEASVEASHAKMFGWSVQTEENPTKWKRVKEKTFLDGLSDGIASLGRLILFMNWYVGGLSEWFCTPDDDEYGSIMQTEPIPVDLNLYIDAIKVDSYFRYGELMAASDSASMKKEEVAKCHKYVSEDDDVLQYSRTGERYSMPAFSLANGNQVAVNDNNQRFALVGGK